MKKLRLLLAILAVVTLFASACGDDGGGDSGAPAETGEETSADDSSMDDSSMDDSAVSDDAGDASDDSAASSDDGGASSDDGGDGDGDSGAASDDADEAPMADVDRDGRIVFATSNLSPSLNNIGVTSEFHWTHIDPIYDTIVATDIDGNLIPGVAESWAVSDDLSTMTLTITDGRTFHDGTPIDADAVKANLDRVLNSETQWVAQIAGVASVAVDGNQVILTLQGPPGSVLGGLADFAGMLMSPAGFDAEDISTNPIGSGPFMPTDYSEAGIEFTRYEGYHDVDSILYKDFEILNIGDDNTRLAGLQSGEIDIALVRAGQVPQVDSAGLATVRRAITQVYALVANTSNEALANADVRRAISHAIDRRSITEGVYLGECQPTVQPYPASFPGAWPDGTVDAYGQYDPDRARQLLAGAGYGDGLTLKGYAPAITTYSDQLEIYQAQLADVGITIDPIVEEPRQFIASVTTEPRYDLFVAPIPTGRPTAAGFWKNYYSADGTRNPGSFALDGIDSMLADLENSLSAEDINAAVQALVAASLEAGPRMIPLCAPTIIWAHQTDIEGVEIHATGRYHFRNAYRTTG